MSSAIIPITLIHEKFHSQINFHSLSSSHFSLNAHSAKPAKVAPYILSQSTQEGSTKHRQFINQEMQFL